MGCRLGQKGWKHKVVSPPPNADLWQTLWALSKEHTIEWHWVRGHSSDPQSERVDRLAQRARLERITPAGAESARPKSPRILLAFVGQEIPVR